MGDYATDTLTDCTLSHPAPTRDGFTWTTVYHADMYGCPLVTHEWLCDACWRGEAEGHQPNCANVPAPGATP